jgi:hypothetical protein
MPTATIEPTFANLLKISLERNYPASIFFKLFKDFKLKLENSSNEKLDSTPLFTNSDKNYLQRDYIYEVLVGADLQNTCEEFINYFSNITTKIQIKDQISILLFINQNEKKFPWKIYSQNLKVLNSLSEYSKYLITIYTNDQVEEFRRLFFLLAKLINYIFLNSKSTKLNETFIETISEFLTWLESNSFNEIHKLLQYQLSEYNISSIKLGFISSDETNHLTELFQANKKIKSHEKENLRSFKLKKIIWLSQKFTIEFVKLDNQFIIDFKKIVNLSNVSTLESMSTFVIELLTGSFECLQLASSTTKHIWRDYIVCKIPWFFKHLLKINQTKLERALVTIFHDDLGFVNEYKDILIELENHLIELELLKPGILELSKQKNINKIEYTLDEMNHNYTNKFLECDPEFTSIEEIEIPEFLEKVNKSINLKHKFCELVSESINSFILTGDTLRLRRLLISCSINFDLLDNLILFDTPHKILLPLLNFFNKQVLQVPDSISMNPAQKYLNQSNQPDLLMDLDIGSDDSSNAQEFFSDICLTLAFVRFLILRYNIILKENELSKIPNILSLLTNSKLVVDKETNKQNPITEIKVDNDTINKWISSMFDSSNVNGISDSLIKISTPIDYSQLIPQIVHEAIICNYIGWLDDDALTGGLEYLHQKFLVGWLVYVIDDICDMKWKTSDKKLEDILERILKQILSNNSNESIDIQVTLKLVKNIMNDKIIENFPNLENTLTKPPIKLSNIENFTNLIKFVSSNEKPTQITDSKLTFELIQVWSVLISEKLSVDYLFNILNDLIRNHQIISELGYELIANILITFSKWMIGETILITWPKGLSQVSETNVSLKDLSENYHLIFNRAASDVVIKGYSSNVKSEFEDNSKNVENGFFGFLQDPVAEEAMDVDTKSNNNEKGIDIYGDNLIVLAYEKKGDPIADAFLRKVLDCLS